MATGYTQCLISDKEKEVEFEKFVMLCARAFGACIDMKEDSLDKDIPEKFEPSKYHIDNLHEAENDLVEFKKLDEYDYEIKARDENKKSLEKYKEFVEHQNFNFKRFHDMRTKVRDWNPPTKNHFGLKEFMIQQLESSIEWEKHNIIKPKLIIGNEWANKELSKILRDIEYHTKEWFEEVERVNSRNKWLKDLRESIKE
jgi:hypothetical protein